MYIVLNLKQRLLFTCVYLLFFVFTCAHAMEKETPEQSVTCSLPIGNKAQGYPTGVCLSVRDSTSIAEIREYIVHKKKIQGDFRFIAHGCLIEKYHEDKTLHDILGGAYVWHNKMHALAVIPWPNNVFKQNEKRMKYTLCVKRLGPHETMVMCDESFDITLCDSISLMTVRSILKLDDDYRFRCGQKRVKRENEWRASIGDEVIGGVATLLRNNHLFLLKGEHDERKVSRLHDTRNSKRRKK